MHQIIYTSAANAQSGPESMASIASHAAQNNKTLEITGLLLVSDNVIFQVLEGAKAHVDMIYSRITEDTRHSGLLLLLSRPIAQREFSHWSSGVAKLQRRNTDHIFNLTKDSLAAITPKNPSPELTTLINTFTSVSRL